MSAKPQLVVASLEGHHATNMPETVSRLQRGGTWRRQRIVVVLPTAEMMPTAVTMALWNLAFPPNNGVVKIAAIGDEVGEAYSRAIESVLNTPQLCDWEYLLCVEHDNLAPGDGVIKLVERMEAHPEFSAIQGLYFTKGAGGCAQIWGSPQQDPVLNYRPQPPDPNGGLIETYGVAQGFTLFRLAMFRDERLKRPWFRTLNGKDGQGLGTQDLVLWNDARQYGYRCAVDCSVKVGHIDFTGDFGPKGFVW
jgi:hypothetical protein